MANMTSSSSSSSSSSTALQKISSSPLHFLLLPYPAQGHFNPMLALAENLQAEGCIITIVLPEQSHRNMMESTTPGLLINESACSTSTDRLHFATFPLDLRSAADHHNVAEMIMAMKQQQGFLESLIQSSNSTDTPISCIVSDFMLPWAQDVANRCGIPRALFWLCSAAVLHIGSVANAGGIYPGAPQLQDIQQKLHISAHVMLEVFDPKDPVDKDWVLGFYKRVDEASHILINTFEALEGHVAPLLPSNTHFIGPCLRPSDVASVTHPTSNDHHHQATIAVAARFGSLVKEDMACLSWLDKQQDESVLFISFGSIVSLPPAQIVEMALGLEASNHRFLWVAREDTNASSSFPEGFLQRTKERGMVIPWAPQLQVLNHPAVGGFLTHCGWNSTIESIFKGVPMLCFPFNFAEQPINEEIIIAGAPHKMEHVSTDEEEHKEATSTSPVGRWSLGFGFEGRRNAGVKSNYVVSRQEVERAVRAFLGDGDDHVGVKLRENARHLMYHAKHALKHYSGSSHVGLISFIEEIRHVKSTTSIT